MASERLFAVVCSVCGGDVYGNEVYGEGRGIVVCADCIDTLWTRLTAAERFTLMGLSPSGGEYISLTEDLDGSLE